jgi:hypothetical protein
MSEATPFTKMSRSRRIDLVEYVRTGLRRRAGLEEPSELTLSSHSEIWLERMHSALASSDCSQTSFDELAVAYEHYLATVPEEESAELQRRVREFIEVRDAIVKATA